MTQLTYAGIGARATPPRRPRTHDRHGRLACAQGLASPLRRRGGSRHGIRGRSPTASQRTLFLPWRGYRGHGGRDLRTSCRSEDMDRCLAIAAELASRVASLLARRQEIARAQCGNSRCRHAGTCPRSGGVVRRRGGHRRHRNEHPHRAGARHPCVESGRAPPPCRLPAA